MAKKQPAVAPVPASRKFAGRKFAVLGKLNYYSAPKELPPLIQAMGGKVATKVTADLDYLVLGRGAAKQKAEAEKLNKKGAAIHILTEDELYDLFEPTREEVLAMLRGGKAQLACWEALDRVNRIKKPSLKGEDLSDLAPPKGARLDLGDLDLDGANFAGGQLDGVGLPDLRGACLDRLSLQNGYLEGLESCTAREAIFACVRATNSEWKKSDFTGANFAGADLDSIWAEACKFRGASFSLADISTSSFVGIDLSETTWAKAKLEGVDLSKANLSQANFQGAELPGVKLRGADLRGANLKDANLDGADMTGANVAGADFTGASLAGANLEKVAIDKAKGIDAGQLPAQAGKKVAELEKFAKKVSWLWINVELADGKVIREMQVGKGKDGQYKAYVKPSRKKGQDYFSINTHSLHSALSAIVSQYPGELQLGALEAKTDKTSLRPRELRQLAVEAWCEAYGIEPPSEEDVKAAAVAAKGAAAARFEQWFARLKSDPKAVAKWNKEVTENERKAGHKGVDLANAKLRKVNFRWLVLEDSTLAGADLTGAELDFARFRRVDLSGAKLDGIRASELKECNLSGASLKKADLLDTNLTKSNLSQADLTGANLVYADLRGADLTGAKLDKVEFGSTRFDEHTRLPDGFCDYKNLEWKGKGTHPGLVAKKPAAAAAVAPARPAASGTLDFAGLMTNLQTSLDQARLDKALSMLK
ncbi:MAG: pentapeptide repeat-containing protein, partial [Planctomycetaceae bacterium]|nr:pentapeptide repeat-containing protein [Planctomycetaceae bacterium]